MMIQFHYEMGAWLGWGQKGDGGIICQCPTWASVYGGHVVHIFKGEGCGGVKDVEGRGEGCGGEG